MWVNGAFFKDLVRAELLKNFQCHGFWFFRQSASLEKMTTLTFSADSYQLAQRSV